MSNEQYKARCREAALKLGLATEEAEAAEFVYRAAVERKLKAAREYAAVINQSPTT